MESFILKAVLIKAYHEILGRKGQAFLLKTLNTFKKKWAVDFF
jgi:hypothetical protein